MRNEGSYAWIDGVRKRIGGGEDSNGADGARM